MKYQTPLDKLKFVTEILKNNTWRIRCGGTSWDSRAAGGTVESYVPMFVIGNNLFTGDIIRVLRNNEISQKRIQETEFRING